MKGDLISDMIYVKYLNTQSIIMIPTHGSWSNMPMHATCLHFKSCKIRIILNVQSNSYHLITTKTSLEYTSNNIKTSSQGNVLTSKDSKHLYKTVIISKHLAS